MVIQEFFVTLANRCPTRKCVIIEPWGHDETLEPCSTLTLRFASAFGGWFVQALFGRNDPDPQVDVILEPDGLRLWWSGYDFEVNPGASAKSLAKKDAMVEPNSLMITIRNQLDHSIQFTDRVSNQFCQNLQSGSALDHIVKSSSDLPLRLDFDIESVELSHNQTCLR